MSKDQNSWIICYCSNWTS